MDSFAASAKRNNHEIHGYRWYATRRCANAVCETNDASALASWALDWNGLIDIKVTAIMDDETIGGVLGPRAEAGEFN